MGDSRSHNGLRVVAVLEAAKGVLVLLVGFGLLAFIHTDLHAALEQLVSHSHLNPAHHYPRIFLDLAEHITDGQLWVLAFSAFLYAIVRIVEAYGLWKQQSWAEWFGLLTGGMYIPLELFEIVRGATWPKITLLLLNIAIVAYLGSIVYQSRKNTP